MEPRIYRPKECPEKTYTNLSALQHDYVGEHTVHTLISSVELDLNELENLTHSSFACKIVLVDMLPLPGNVRTFHAIQAEYQEGVVSIRADEYALFSEQSRLRKGIKTEFLAIRPEFSGGTHSLHKIVASPKSDKRVIAEHPRLGEKQRKLLLAGSNPISLLVRACWADTLTLGRVP